MAGESLAGYEVPKHFVDQFGANVRHAVQQKQTRIYGQITRSEEFIGEQYSFDVVGDTVITEASSRFEDTQFSEISRARRWGSTRVLRWATLCDRIDKLKMLHDPQHEYVQSASYAFARGRDDVAILSAFASVKEGKKGENTTAFPATNVIEDAGNNGLTIARMLDIKKRIMESDIDPDLEWVWYCTPNDIVTLLNTTEIKDADYNTVKALASGKVDTFMGFRFVWTNRLERNMTDKLSHNIVCVPSLAFVKSEQESLFVKISDRPDKSHAKQVFMEAVLGITRYEDKAIFCVESYDANLPEEPIRNLR